jgi:hypothetical protein
LRRPRLPVLVRRAVIDRAAGLCDFCGGILPELLVEAHHRKLRSRGGKDTIENLIALHPGCHHWIHQHPEKATETGFMVHSWDDPATVPILLAQRYLCLPGLSWEILR